MLNLSLPWDLSRFPFSAEDETIDRPIAHLTFSTRLLVFSDPHVHHLYTIRPPYLKRLGNRRREEKPSMGSSRWMLERSLWLKTFIAVLFLSSAGLAQSVQSDASSTGETSTGATSTSSDTLGNTVSISNAATTPTMSATTTAAMPAITGTTASSDTSFLTGLPTLSKTADTAIPTYPAPSVPPTQNAPFMNHSNLPNGTVFIAVGAILGAFGVAILAWRAITAWQLHRAINRAAMGPHDGSYLDKSPLFPLPPAPFYKYWDQESSPSLSTGTTSGRGQRRTNRGPTNSTTPSTTNLFFSPTAPGIGGNGSVSGGVSNRDSRYLPSGFYAASSATPTPPAHQPYGQGSSISMANLRPSASSLVGGGASLDPSPPESPSIGETSQSPLRSANGLRSHYSTSSINLGRLPNGRAPSAYLDDLLDDQPGGWPPAPSGAQQLRQGSVSSQGGRL